MKILYITTVGGTMRFFKKFIEELIQEGHTVDIATCESEKSKVPPCYREWGCKVYQLTTSRSPLNGGNLKAISQIRKIVQDNQYEMVHCHTPIAAACTRLACRNLRKKGLKVYYTAHGFHFYKGAPLKNWLIYYPVEKICAHWTDMLITMNEEDYAVASEKMKAKRVEYIPGVGIDVARFRDASVDRLQKRAELNVPADAFLLLSVGELSHRKNHETALKAIALLKDPSVHYIIAGKGSKQEYLENLASELGLENNLHLLGYRSDIPELNKTADMFIFPSFQEGLPVSLMEAMAAGLPVVCSEIRGNVDLVKNGETGYLADPFDPNTFAEMIKKVREKGGFSEKCMEEAEKYNITKINQKMHQFYFG